MVCAFYQFLFSMLRTQRVEDVHLNRVRKHVEEVFTPAPESGREGFRCVGFYLRLVEV